jgi:hypothetical protein
MDWTEPPTELNAMGIDSDFLIFGEDQIDWRRDCRGVLRSIFSDEVARSGLSGLGQGDRRMSHTGP